VIEDTLARHRTAPASSLAAVHEADREARVEAERLLA